MQLVLASRNAHKVHELKVMLQAFGIEVKALADFPNIPELEETGATFRDNARQKAKTVADLTGLLTLADDSGLMVDALNGAPGVISARYAATATTVGNATDAANNAKLLREMRDIPEPQRTARYVCVLALLQPKNGKEWHFEGLCEGEILSAPRGSGGFGYDPLFYLPQHHCTMAEISLEEKNKISHRARATQQLVKALPNIMRELA